MLRGAGVWMLAGDLAIEAAHCLDEVAPAKLQFGVLAFPILFNPQRGSGRGIAARGVPACRPCPARDSRSGAAFRILGFTVTYCYTLLLYLGSGGWRLT